MRVVKEILAGLGAMLGMSLMVLGLFYVFEPGVPMALIPITTIGHAYLIGRGLLK